MKGLKYILFVQEIPMKEVVAELNVSIQLINAWSNGRKPIAAHHLEVLSRWLKVDAELINKDELTLEDKIAIERQLHPEAVVAEPSSLALSKKTKEYEHLEQRYLSLLEAMKVTEQRNHQLEQCLQSMDFLIQSIKK